MPREGRLQQWKPNWIAIYLCVSAAVCILSGCKPKNQLIDYKVPGTPEGRRAVRAAPLVLLGSIDSDNAAGPDTVSHWDKALPLRLHKIEVTVEGWLRGDLHLSKVDLYYYRINGPYEGPPLLGDWTTGGLHAQGFHRIFFVRRDGNLLRLACDYRDTCTIRVGSGMHPDINTLIAGNVPLEAKIANILFTKGVGVSNNEFANSLSYSIFEVDEQYYVPKLKQLIESSDPEIRKEACGCMPSMHYGYPERDERVKTLCQQFKIKESELR